MSEWDQQTEEETVRRLIEQAGPRPPIPPEDLDAISAAARSAWRLKVGQTAEGPRQGSRTPRMPRKRFRTLALALAAALAVALGLAWWSGSRDSLPAVPPTAAWVEAVAGAVQLEAEENERRPIAQGDAIPQGAALRSEPSGRAALRLAGGIAVRLDAETRLRFASASVLELESGAVYVDTGSGPHGPVEVRTPLGTVRDVGTRFAVQVEPETALRVLVRDGEVLTEHRGRTYRTPAGRALELRRDGTAASRAVALHGAPWGWTLEAAPGFDAEGRSLQELLDWVSRETGWRIVYTDKGLAGSASKIVLHGSLGGLRPDQAPFAVLPGAGLEGELKDGTLVVRTPR